MRTGELLVTDGGSGPAALMLRACPFLERYRGEDWDCGDTIIFGDVARLLQEGALSLAETGEVFQFFNGLAETGDKLAVDVLATGAIETSNDNGPSQELARQHLSGSALQLLETMRVRWCQPDYARRRRA